MRTGLQKHEAKAKHTIPGSSKEIQRKLTGRLRANKSVDNDKEEEIANQSIYQPSVSKTKRDVR